MIHISIRYMNIVIIFRVYFKSILLYKSRFHIFLVVSINLLIIYYLHLIIVHSDSICYVIILHYLFIFIYCILNLLLLLQLLIMVLSVSLFILKLYKSASLYSTIILSWVYHIISICMGITTGQLILVIFIPLMLVLILRYPMMHR